MYFAEEGYRYTMFVMPCSYNLWGFDVWDREWPFYGQGFDFCVVDDFGNAVPVDPWNTYTEGYQSVWAPNHQGKYRPYHQTIH